jgi:hypothetical protein
MAKNEFSYTVLPDGRVRIMSNSTGQVAFLTRGQIEKALSTRRDELSPKLISKYEGALKAFEKAQG